MTRIELSTHINAPIERCFDLARSIDLHMESTKQTGEQAIAGRTSGLIGLGETVTWRAKHLGVWQTLIFKKQNALNLIILTILPMKWLKGHLNRSGMSIFFMPSKIKP